jgi:uncharacterized protein YlxP (DUF503 family)
MRAPSRPAAIIAKVYVGALEIEIHLPATRSLKAKRSVVKHLIEASRQRFGVSASEVAHHDRWQRAGLGFTVVAPSAAHAQHLLDQVERFVWSHPEIEVISVDRHWLDTNQD